MDPCLALLRCSALALAVAAGAFACNFSGADEAQGDGTLLDAVADYRTWARPPGPFAEPLAPSDGPHGAAVDIYINEVVVDALASEPGTLSTWPEGSIIVKDGWRDVEGTDLRFIALMERRADGWYWEEFTGDDLVRPLYAGEPEICTGCHAAGSDSVRAFSLP